MEKKFKLEEFVENNYDLFNTEEPPEGHFDRFKAKLEKKSSKGKSIVFKSMRYAAVILVLLTGYLIVDQSNIFNKVDITADNQVEDDFSEVSGYYNAQIDQKYEELNQITCKKGNDQKVIVNNDLIELSESYKELENELKENPDNPLIKNAMINNYQTRIQVLDMVINTLKSYC